MGVGGVGYLKTRFILGLVRGQFSYGFVGLKMSMAC